AWGLGRTVLSVLRFPADEKRLERFVLAMGLGLSGVSLFTLLMGLAGLLQRAWFFAAFGIMAAAGTVIAGRAFIIRRRSANMPQDAHTQTDPVRAISPALPAACIAAVVPFLVAMALGAMLPSTDFDVKEYHLQGPKEFYQQGRITMLPHNV